MGQANEASSIRQKKKLQRINMTFKLVDVTRGKVLQEFDSIDEAEKTLRHQSCEDFVRLEIQEEVVAKPKPKPKAKKADVKKESV